MTPGRPDDGKTAGSVTINLARSDERGRAGLVNGIARHASVNFFDGGRR